MFVLDPKALPPPPPPNGFEAAVLEPKPPELLVFEPKPPEAISAQSLDLKESEIYLPALLFVPPPKPPKPLLWLLLAFEPKEKPPPPPLPKDMLAGIDERRAIFASGGRKQVGRERVREDMRDEIGASKFVTRFKTVRPMPIQGNAAGSKASCKDAVDADCGLSLPTCHQKSQSARENRKLE